MLTIGVETTSYTTITSGILVDDVRVKTETVTTSYPYTTTVSGVSTGYETITKPQNSKTCAIISRTKTDHTQIVTSTPKVSSSLCSVTKPYTSDIVKTETKCSTIGGPGHYKW